MSRLAVPLPVRPVPMMAPSVSSARMRRSYAMRGRRPSARCDRRRAGSCGRPEGAVCAPDPALRAEGWGGTSPPVLTLSGEGQARGSDDRPTHPAPVREDHRQHQDARHIEKAGRTQRRDSHAPCAGAFDRQFLIRGTGRASQGHHPARDKASLNGADRSAEWSAKCSAVGAPYRIEGTLSGIVAGSLSAAPNFL